MNVIKSTYFFLILLCITVAFNSCVKSFVPAINKYNELLVVDGNVNDGPGPYIIKLSKSTGIRQISNYVPYSNCTVGIEDNLGNKFTLSEKAPGAYYTDSVAMRGIPGRSYKLSIGTSEGEWYESNPEVLLKGIAIQSVQALREQKSDPKYFHGRDGYQFYVDAETPATSTNYLFWRLQSTYKFSLDYGIGYYYDKGIHVVIHTDTLRICYRTVDILDLFLLNTTELKQTEIKHFPLHYEDNYTKALSIRYSLKVSQFTINEATFNYWNAIKKIVDMGGDLFTYQPYQIPNNLKNVTHPDKHALGYFMVAGISEKRIFIKPYPFIIREGICVLTDQMNPFGWFVERPDQWPVFYTEGGKYLPPECLDCRKTGALEKPPYWIE